MFLLLLSDLFAQAITELKRSTGFDAIEVRLLDAADFASAKAFADGIANEVGRVDILILNAGMANIDDNEKFVTASNGTELTCVLLLAAYSLLAQGV